MAVATKRFETEALLCAAQEQTLRTRYIKHNIDKTEKNPACRMCGEKAMSWCGNLGQTEYLKRHDAVARSINWNMCGKFGMERANKWYEHEAGEVVENEEVKILRDFMIQCDRMVKHRGEKIEKYQKLKIEIGRM